MESWIEAENEKCGGNLSPTRLYKKPTTVLWVNIRMNISKFQGMGFVHFIYGQCLFLKVEGCRDNRSHSEASTNVYIYSTVSKI